MAEPTDLPAGLTEQPDEVQPRSTRDSPDVLALLVGVASLIAATFAIVGFTPTLPSFDARWLLAGGAAGIGLLLLVSSLRRPRHRADLDDA